MNFLQYKYKKSHIKAASCFEVLEVFFDGLLDFGDGVIGGGGAEHGDPLLVHHELNQRVNTQENQSKLDPQVFGSFNNININIKNKMHYINKMKWIFNHM